MRPFLAAATLMALAACSQNASDNAADKAGQTTVPAQPAATEAPQLNSGEPLADQCGADQLGRFLNVLPTETVKADIASAAGQDRIRDIEPGAVVTQDLRPDRLNVETGEDGRIKLFRCG